MSENVFGLLSGKYDSTKQRAVLLNGDRLRNFKSYTATMRLELLLAGHLILPDAQFFDGLYFHWVAHDECEFNAIKKLMVPFEESCSGKKRLFSIAVKCRSPEDDEKPPKPYSKLLDLNKVAVKMYCKPFYFSSIEEEELIHAVFEMGQDYETEYQEDIGQPKEEVCKPENDLHEYVIAVKVRLTKIFGEKSNLVVRWEEYSKRLEEMFDIPANRWGFWSERGQWVLFDFKDGMEKALDQVQSEWMAGENQQSYRDHMKALLDEAEGPSGMDNNPAAKRYFASIKDELSQNVMKRSAIVTAMDALERLYNQSGSAAEESSDKKAYIKDCLNDFRQLMNDRYNKTLAYQHGSQFLDLCDYQKISDLIFHRRIKTEFIPIDDNLMNSLAELSWDAFVARLERHRSKLESSFREWMSAYKEYDRYSENPTLYRDISSYGTYSDDPESDLSRRLMDYLNTIRSIMGNMGDAERIKDLGPWDIAGTYSKEVSELISEDCLPRYYFVGGGSFEASPDGNEICILCGASGKQSDMKILRLHLSTVSSTEDEDKDFNSILAPVFNSLNGGALVNVKEKAIEGVSL